VTSPHVQCAAERLIRRACRHLPDDARDERYREWAAELPAILHDPDIRFTLVRSARALRYAAGIYRSTHHLRGAAGMPAKDTRQPAIFPRADGVFPALAALIAWIGVLVLVLAHPPQSGFWLPLTIAASFVPNVLFAFAAVRFVLWARRRSKRTPRPRSLPPGDRPGDSPRHPAAFPRGPSAGS
jgi:hypothetical protein